MKMKIKLKKIKIKDLVNGYEDKGDNGVFGYGGKLDIRPPYQREFKYDNKEKAQEAVIKTVMKGFPLNVMYWAKCADGKFEMIDGQQRALSICRYHGSDEVPGKFTANGKLFQGLTQSEKQKFYNYNLQVYFCEGTDKEKLEWFEVINTFGEKLNKQELLNAVYHSPWLDDARRYFSKEKGPAFAFRDYMKGTMNDQDYLAAVLDWIAKKNNTTVEDYMAKHSIKKDAKELWEYFLAVMDWVKDIFHIARPKIMQGIKWGILYDKYHRNNYDPHALENKIKTLLQDEEKCDKHKGIYEFLLSGEQDKSLINKRAFSPKQKRIIYERQQGNCAICETHLKYDKCQADHKIPHIKGGKTEVENGQILCQNCNTSIGAR